ncbi:MAG: hypothetical protein J0I10_13020 [Verrucomicrobia bacterium]|nr:hypothetical protein [Verrucomicrobiota bacterium]
MSILITLIVLAMGFQIIWGLCEIAYGIALMLLGIALYIVASIRDAALALLGKS